METRPKIYVSLDHVTVFTPKSFSLPFSTRVQQKTPRDVYNVLGAGEEKDRELQKRRKETKRNRNSCAIKVLKLIRS